MAHWKLFLEGPPNKPNEDEYGLIEVHGFYFMIVNLFIDLTYSVTAPRLCVDFSKRANSSMELSLQAYTKCLHCHVITRHTLVHIVIYCE